MPYFFYLVPSWRMVRLLGELKVLTRVSYISLILVPILVVAWDGIEITLNEWNGLGNEQIAKVLEFTELELVDSLTKVVQDVNAEMDKLKAKSTTNGKTSYPFPLFWIQVFICALLIAIAHLIYQLFCPEEIQEYSLESYINSKKDQYIRFGTNYELELAELDLGSKDADRILGISTKVEQNIDGLKGLIEENKKKKIFKMKLFELYDIRDFLRVKVSKTDFEKNILTMIEKRLIKAESKDINFVELNIIAKAAALNYKLLSRKSPASIYLTTILYLMGLYFLCLVTSFQVWRVITSGGALEWWQFFWFVS